MPKFLMFDSWILENETPTTEPVAFRSVFIRNPLVELVTIESWKLAVC